MDNSSSSDTIAEGREGTGSRPSCASHAHLTTEIEAQTRTGGPEGTGTQSSHGAAAELVLLGNGARGSQGGCGSEAGEEKTGGNVATRDAAVRDGPPPDGGLRAWWTVAGGFCGLFVSFGWINCIGVFIDYYKTHQLRDFPTSTITWITSLEIFMMFFGGPVVGALFDNFGPRWILIIGSFFHVFGLMMTSISSEYYQFLLAQGICSPIGTSAIFHACLNSVSTWFRRRRALALGITTCGSSFGGIIFPIMVTRLIPILGFGWAMRICAFTSLFLLIITNLTTQSRLEHRRKPFHPGDFLRPLREIPFLLTTAGSFAVYWGLFLPFAFIPTQAERYGMSSYLASYLIPILNAARLVFQLS
ncbi:hypothetical protein AOCH_005620 [Aspergillus ochraceoroseus]|uniref:Major facilitator superfamily (MFS) profile domain-containing protein n=1 Tax=Aspergillus ochraceoroseus TaxID=138278 RepID=A0A0F8XEP0_9EURO|nr:hypothetical protein AOCH_005620 [Aspergillus ochraceoroseus]